jgi:hypothetical protein
MHAENSPVSYPENFIRDVQYMLVCGIIWKERADLVAGWELIRGLNSQDRLLREIAKGILVECGQPSMELLESAFANGGVTPDSAGECISELFRVQSKEAWTSWEQTSD